MFTGITSKLSLLQDGIFPIDMLTIILIGLIIILTVGSFMMSNIAVMERGADRSFLAKAKTGIWSFSGTIFFVLFGATLLAAVMLQYVWIGMISPIQIIFLGAFLGIMFGFVSMYYTGRRVRR